jgi:hypothetical protein
MPWALVVFLALGEPHAGYGIRTDGTMAVRGVADEYAKVAGTATGWTLPVDLPGDGGRCRTELRDVSPIPGHLLKWVEWLDNAAPRTALKLDARRYVGSHTYHMSIHCGLREIQHAYVHLLALPDEVRPARFELDGGKSKEADATEILTVPKGQL